MAVVLALVLVALAPAAGCDHQADPLDFQITLEFASNHGGPRACTDTCEAYPLTCPGRMSVRIARADNPNDEYQFRCIPAPARGNLCSLDDLEIRLGSLPVGPARIEVALWNETVLDEGRCLRGPLFDLQGEPLVTVSPQPAVAGAVYFDIGLEPRARIPMACTAPTQVALPECAAPE